MNALLELAPLAAFFLAYVWKGLYVATAVLMVASVAVLLAHRLTTGRFKDLHVITAALVLPLGGATLLLHDKRFIQWKPTAVFGVLAVALLISGLVGRRPLMQRLFLAMVPDGITLGATGWRRLNLLWAGWFALSAAANLYVAENFSERIWVHFHTYGLSVATFLFMLPQVFWLAARTGTNAAARDDVAPAPDRSMNETSRVGRIRDLLQTEFSPSTLEIEDESHAHAGHAGAAGGLGHFRVRIVAPAFAGLPRIARHQRIYAALGSLMRTDIHALAIEARAPDEGTR